MATKVYVGKTSVRVLFDDDVWMYLIQKKNSEGTTMSRLVNEAIRGLIHVTDRN